MSSRFTSVVVAVLALLPEATLAGTWSVGSHFGFSSLKGAKGGGTTTVLGTPSTPLAYQPGLRLGFGDRGRTHELQLDTSWFLVDEGGSSLSMLVESVGYQRTFRSAWTHAPFVNLSVGFFREGGEVRSAVSTLWGAGVGFRRLVGDGHGDLRLEGRVDHLQEAEKFERPEITSWGIRFGFDLWM
jgi:hypothetical protein